MSQAETELANDLLLHSDVLRDWIRRIRTDIQNISKAGWYRALDIQRARLGRRRQLVGGGSGQAREAAEALVELVRRRAGAVLANASA